MSTLLVATLVIGLAAPPPETKTTVAGHAPMSSNTTERHVARIRALDEALKAAAARRDLDGMLAVYAPDAQELLPNVSPIVGRDSIRALYRGLFEQLPRLAHQIETHEIIVAQSGDLAVVRGSFRFTADTLRPDDVQTGKFVGVWRHRDGDWRLQINISNGNPPAPGPQPGGGR